MTKKGYFLPALVLSAGLWAGCEHPAKPAEAPAARPARPAVAQPPAPPANVPKEAVAGDFDGDGRPEYVWLVPPEVLENLECQGGCNSYLRFSNAALPAIEQENCIEGTPDNLGDLNEDGGDEIGLLPHRFMGCWVGYYVYTYRAGRWQPLVEPFSTYCNQWEDGVIPIEKDPSRKGYVLIRYTDSADTTFTLQTKSVPVR
ncbi:MAG: heat shock protein DnaJ domain protein [Hymenobacter sp.]|nr:heat shock protein DnaJ domain protein [Hymenobacter sp.]